MAKTSDWLPSVDIYNVVESVENLKKKFIEDEDETTLAAGIFGFLTDTEAKKIQTAAIMTGELGNEMFPQRAKLDKNVVTHAIYCNVEDLNAVPAHMTAHRDESGGRDIAGVRAEGYRLYDVGRVAYAAADDERDVVSYAFVSQPRVYRGEREFDGYAHVVAYTRRRCARAASETVYRDDVGSASRYAAGYRGDIVDGGYLYYDGLFVFCRLFEREHELTKIFD